MRLPSSSAVRLTSDSASDASTRAGPDAAHAYSVDWPAITSPAKLRRSNTELPSTRSAVIADVA